MSTAERVAGGRQHGIELEQGESGTYYASHNMDEDGLTVTLAIALGEVANVEPLELVPSLSEYADPSALDRLFRTRPDGRPRQGGEVTLTIEGYTVTVHSTGTIAINVPEN